MVQAPYSGDAFYSASVLSTSFTVGTTTTTTTGTSTTGTTSTTTTTTTTTTTPGPCDSQKQFLKIQLRRGSQTDFISSNPVLASGEPAYAIDSQQFKIGNGEDNWNDLPSFVNENAVSGIVMTMLNDLNII